MEEIEVYADRTRISGYHWLLFFICFLANVFGGTVSTLMSVYLPIAVKDLLGSSREVETPNFAT